MFFGCLITALCRGKLRIVGRPKLRELIERATNSRNLVFGILKPDGDSILSRMKRNKTLKVICEMFSSSSSKLRAKLAKTCYKIKKNTL